LSFNTYQSVREERGLDPELPVAILALGKLGSREMNYLSDLDLVFVYDSPADLNGEIPLEVIPSDPAFHAHVEHTAAGRSGLCVDARLRPTGNYGPLVVTRTVAGLLCQSCRCMEVKALLRVRAIAGKEKLCRWLEEEALSLCYRKRDAAFGLVAALPSAARMEQERSDESGGGMDVKLGTGGLADTEFLSSHQLLFGISIRVTDRVYSMRPAEHAGYFPGPVQAVSGAYGNFRRVPRALEHRLQLLTNLSGSNLTPGQIRCDASRWALAAALRGAPAGSLANPAAHGGAG